MVPLFERAVLRVNSFDITSDDDAAAVYFHRAEVPRPAAATTQWFAFRMRSDGLFANSPGSHFAVVLRARLGFDGAGRPVSIAGRGMTLGDTSLAVAPASNPHAFGDPAFGGARGAQVESFWPGGNFLHRDARALDEGLRDGIDYRVELHVSDARWVAFRIADGAGRAMHDPMLTQVQDRPSHPVPADATGVVIALGRGPRETEGGAWRVRFSEIACGWF